MCALHVHLRPVSVRFLQKKPASLNVFADLVETAIARSAKHGTSVVLDCQQVPFSAGGFFVCGQDVPLRQIEKMYVEQEHVFANRHVLRRFLRILGRSPISCSFLSFEAGVHPNADIILLLVSPSDASRVLGLLAYGGNFEVDCIPAAPTCAALFRPLLRPKAVHVNFIDYFDRDMQARGFFAPQELLLGMTPQLYRALERARSQSPHGEYLPSEVPVYPVMPPLDWRTDCT